MNIYPGLQKFFIVAKNVEDSKPKDRDVYTFYNYLKTILKVNSRLMGHFITRTTALTAFDWSMEGSDQKAAEEAVSRLRPLINDIISNHAYAALFGSSLYILELVNNEYGSQLRLKNKRDQSMYDYDLPYIYIKDENGNILNTININDDMFYLIDTAPYYAKGGILRTIMPSEIIRFDMVIENANWLRKLKGILQVINKNAAPSEQRAAELAAQTAIRDNYLVTSDLIEFRLNQIAGQGGTAFKDFINSIDRSISIAILGQANTAELPTSGGSRAALQVMKMISADIAYSDMVRIEALVNKLLLRDYRLNRSLDAASVPYKFRFKIEQEEDILKNADAINVLKTAGIPLIRKEVYEKIGFSIPGAGEETI